MKFTNWKDIAELLGIAAIVASLIFVGLQMKQAQEIAIAAQYQERYATSIDVLIALEQSENQRIRFEQTIIDFWGLPPGWNPDSKPGTFASAYISDRIALQTYDNLHFQYMSGFLTEEAWATTIAQMQRALRSPIHQYILDNNNNVVYRKSFLDLCDELRVEIDSADAHR